MSGGPQNYDIQKAALHLGFKIRGDPLDRNKGDDAIIDLKERTISNLGLAFYGNQLGMYFYLESIVAHSVCYLMKYQHPSLEEQPRKLEEIKDSCKFMLELFQNEFILPT